MQESLVELLVCPLCQGNLELQIFNTLKKDFNSGSRPVIESGVLVCRCHFHFPIIQSVPRMLIESFLDYEEFLKNNVVDFHQIKEYLTHGYAEILKKAQQRNRYTKATFSLEWSLLQGREPVKIWRLGNEVFKEQLFSELKLTDDYFRDKIILDVGCGHGHSTALLSEKCGTAIGFDLGLSVLRAGSENVYANCHFIQADLHLAPFKKQSFDILYSSGVLHHTPDTESAFRIVSGFVKKGGICCVWLYKPYNNAVHKSILRFRKITSRLPLKVQFWFYLVFLVPVHKMVGWIRHRNPRHWREIMIELLDSLSPRYRSEQEPGAVKLWFEEAGFDGIELTTSDELGFSMKGQKEARRVP